METTEVAKTRRTISPELKEKMRAGRAKAAKEREALKKIHDVPKRWLQPKHVSATPPVLKESVTMEVPAHLHGITQRDCPIGCTAERCVITGEPICGHPCKGGIQPIHKLNQEIVERHNSARSHLAHVELSRRQGS